MQGRRGGNSRAGGQEWKLAALDGDPWAGRWGGCEAVGGAGGAV